jgi:hypothetical protein
MFSAEDYSQDVSMLVELGLVAIKQGDEESAKKLFNAVGILDPENLTKKMGFGLIAIHKLDILEAVKHFDEVVKIEPKNARAIGFLAFAHMLGIVNQTFKNTADQLKKTNELAQLAIELADDESTKQLAQSILDWQAQLQKIEQ